MRFNPYKKGRGGGVLTILMEGHKRFWGSFSNTEGGPKIFPRFKKG